MNQVEAAELGGGIFISKFLFLLLLLLLLLLLFR
jgi:hypothetical protein